MPEQQQLLTVRLADGSLVTWTAEHIAEYQDDWSAIIEVIDEQNAQRFLGCLAHGDDVKCEVCGDDA